MRCSTDVKQTVPLKRTEATKSAVAEILAGLQAFPKTISPKYFYDAQGSLLFEEICTLPEYYPTRTEISILETHAEDIARRIGPRAALIEYGSGSSQKTRILLDNLFDPAYYMPVEISRSALEDAVSGLREEYPSLRVWPQCADYMKLNTFPAKLPRWLKSASTPPSGDIQDAKRLLFFPGSTIGNLHPRAALEQLRRMRAVGGVDCALLIGVDLRKDVSVLEQAYNDAQGITARFNLNLLHHLNSQFGADFPVENFTHRAFFNPEESRIEMHLIARRDCRVQIAGEPVTIGANESIHTENSYKYTLTDMREMLRQAGFDPTDEWTDPRHYFSVFYAEGT